MHKEAAVTTTTRKSVPAIAAAALASLALGGVAQADPSLGASVTTGIADASAQAGTNPVQAGATAPETALSIGPSGTQLDTLGQYADASDGQLAAGVAGEHAGVTTGGMSTDGTRMGDDHTSVAIDPGVGVDALGRRLSPAAGVRLGVGIAPIVEDAVLTAEQTAGTALATAGGAVWLAENTVAGGLQLADSTVGEAKRTARSTVRGARRKVRSIRRKAARIVRSTKRTVDGVVQVQLRVFR